MDSAPKPWASHAGPSFFAIHFPVAWFEGDPSLRIRHRQFVVLCVQFVWLMFLIAFKDLVLTSWTLYANNQTFFGVLMYYIISQFANISHNANDLSVTKAYNVGIYTAIALSMMNVILFGAIIHETVECAAISKEDFNELMACEEMELQSYTEGRLDCSTGAATKTRATGTCPAFEFHSISKGNAWMFFQYLTIIFYQLTLFMNILDSSRIVTVLIDINVPEELRLRAESHRPAAEILGAAKDAVNKILSKGF